MIELLVNNVKKYKGTNMVLRDISFQVYDGERVGIVGVNGCGKSTLLKLIAGIEELNIYQGSVSLGYDEGNISITKGATTSYLDQLPNYEGEKKVIDILTEPFEGVFLLEEEMHRLEEEMRNLQGQDLKIALKTYSEMQNKFEVMGGYEVDERIKRVALGLEFSEDFLNKSFGVLSGGERTTVILGKLLIEKPDILLLDEPTNHLDIASIEWLENYLKSYKGIVIIVSHDRYFLDNVVTKIIEIEDKECKTYNGNYSKFTKLKEEAIIKQFEDYKQQQKKIKSMEDTAKTLRDWAGRSDNVKFIKRAASIEKRLEKMDRIENPDSEKDTMKLRFKTSERSGKITIKAESLYKSFEDKGIFRDANMVVNYGERVALIGENGCGKTTFVKMLLNEETIDSGKAELGASVKMAYLPQNFKFQDEDMTLLECFREDISILEGKAREYLSKFMFYGSTVYKKVSHLSGGERIRLKLSKLLYEDINLLILDEPTNHLDIESIETLEEALEDFKGTIFFISHDRYFINKISSRLIAIENGNFKTYEGDYDYYRVIKEEEKLAEIKKEQVKVKEKAKKIKKVVPKEKKLDTNKLEARIEELEEKIKEISIYMESTEVDYKELNDLYETKESLSNELNEVMELWIKAQNEN